MSSVAERITVRENVLIYLLISFILMWLGGCSCSERPSENVNLSPGLRIADIQIDEGDETKEVTFSVSLKRDGDNSTTVTVDYEILPNSNDTLQSAKLVTSDDESGADIVFSGGVETLIFEPFEESVAIKLMLAGDTIFEHDEVFFVKLFNASGANIIVDGGGDEAFAQVTIVNDDPKPKASIEIDGGLGSLELNEQDTSEKLLSVSLNTISGVDSQIILRPSNELLETSLTAGTIAAYRIDYLLSNNSKLLSSNISFFIPAGETEAQIALSVVDDGIQEQSETFEIRLVPSDSVDVADDKINVSIIDNEPAVGSVAFSKLNDTGVVEGVGIIAKSSDLNFDTSSLNQSQLQNAVDDFQHTLILQMDANFGRDKLSNDVSNGFAGFDFTKLDSNGLPTTAVPQYDTETRLTQVPWDCVKDNVTGLIWEVKIPSNRGLRSATRHFHWYDPNFSTNGGEPGEVGDYQCNDDINSEIKICNTAYYVADINTKKLCGMTGWRLPTIEELRSIANYGVENDSNLPAYDTNYFPGDLIGSSFIWTSTTDSTNPEKALTIRFGLGVSEEPRNKKDQTANSGIRLVNSSQLISQ